MNRLVLALLLVIPSFASAEELPNVVIIFTDDQGYSDVGCFGAEGFETPRLDRMASEGMKFTDFYVAQAVWRFASRVIDGLLSESNWNVRCAK